MLPGGLKTLHTLANVPKSWPLSRLTIPLSGFSKQLERLLEGHCMEVMVTNTSPELQLHSIKKFAKDLVLLFALHMAEKISSLLRQVLDHPTKVLYDPETEALFLPLFWFLPIYRELLNTASRHRPSRNSELRRSASGLAKVIFFLARSCLGQVPGGAPFSQRSELATACTSRMQIKNLNRTNELTNQARRSKLRIKPEGN